MEVSYLSDIVNLADEDSVTKENEVARNRACQDLAWLKVQEFAKVFDSLGTTDKDVLDR